MVENETPTISISVSPITRERIEYIKQQLGLTSRSSAVTMAINDMHSRLVNQAHKRLVQKDFNNIAILNKNENPDWEGGRSID